MEDRFQNNSTGLDGIENQLLIGFEGIVTEYFGLEENQKNTNWISHRIKESFGKLAADYDFNSCSSIEKGEWLFDLVWYKSDSIGRLNEVTLVLESELSERNKRGLQFDFDKLLASNSEHRVFLCFAEGNFNSPSNVNNIVSWLQQLFDNYTNLAYQSRVLALIWDDYQYGKVFPHLMVKS